MNFLFFNKPTLFVIDRFGQCYGKTFYRHILYELQYFASVYAENADFKCINDIW